MATITDVQNALKNVKDPEIDMDIVTIELVRDIQIIGDTAKITMTLTSPQCPFGPMIVDSAKAEAEKVPGISEAAIELSFVPPWEPSAELRALLGV